MQFFKKGSSIYEILAKVGGADTTERYNLKLPDRPIKVELFSYGRLGGVSNYLKDTTVELFGYRLRCYMFLESRVSIPIYLERKVCLEKKSLLPVLVIDLPLPEIDPKDHPRFTTVSKVNMILPRDTVRRWTPFLNPDY